MSGAGWGTIMTNMTTRRHLLLAGASIAALLLAHPPARAEDQTDTVEVPKISVTDSANSNPTSANTMTEGSKSYAAQASGVADKVGTPLKETANTVSVETRQYLDDRGTTDIFQAMRNMPGVTALPNDGVQAQYNARGYGVGGMTNGISSFNSFSTFQQLDLSIYDHLEYVHGPSGVMNGGSTTNMIGAGGVVNMVTKKAQKNYAASVTQSVGSWNNYRTEGDVTGPLNADGSLRARLVVAGQDRSFYYDRSSQVKRVGYGEIEYDINPSTLLTAYATIQTNRQTPFYGAPLSTTGQRLNLPRSFNTMTWWSMNNDEIQEEGGSLEHNFANGWTAKVQGISREEYDHARDSEQSTGVNTTTMTTSYFGPSDSTYTYFHHAEDAYIAGPFEAFGRTHKLLIGANAESYRYDTSSGSLSNVNNVNIFSLPTSLTTDPSIPYTSGSKYKAVQYGPYGQVRLQVLDPVTLVGGGRVTNFDYRDRNVPPSTATNWKDESHYNGVVTPYGGLIYEVNKQVSLYGSWSDVFVPQTNKDYQGNVLSPREGQQYEVGVKTSWLDDRLNSSIALYDLDDVNGSMKDTVHSTNTNTYYVSAGEVVTRGVDYEISGKPAPGWDISASYSYMYSQYKTNLTLTGATPTNWYPRHLVKTWGKYSFEQGPLKGLSLGMGVYAQSRIWGNSSNSYIAQSSYATLDGMIGYEVNDNLSLNFNANNITDTKYFITTGRSTGTYNTYGDPRNFMLTLKAKI